jgi:hypothetical protein
MKLVEARARSLSGSITPLSRRLVLQCNIEGSLKKSTQRSGGADLPGLDVETGSLAYALEQGGLGRGHPHLAPPFEAGEKGRTAPWIEVRGNLVEQQDRRLAAAPGDKLGLTKN